MCFSVSARSCLGAEFLARRRPCPLGAQLRAACGQSGPAQSVRADFGLRGGQVQGSPPWRGGVTQHRAQSIGTPTSRGTCLVPRHSPCPPVCPSPLSGVPDPLFLPGTHPLASVRSTGPRGPGAGVLGPISPLHGQTVPTPLPVPSKSCSNPPPAGEADHGCQPWTTGALVTHRTPPGACGLGRGLGGSGGPGMSSDPRSQSWREGKH